MHRTRQKKHHHKHHATNPNKPPHPDPGQFLLAVDKFADEILPLGFQLSMKPEGIGYLIEIRPTIAVALEKAQE
jgi:hypothetical protein